MTVRLHRVAALAAAALPAVCPPGARAQWNPQIEAGVFHDRNFSRAQREADRISDTAFTLTGVAERSLPVGPDVSVGGEARLARYVHSEGASYASAGVTAAWRSKLGLGLTAPSVVARASAGLENAREAVRDATRLAASLSVRKRFD